MRDTESDPRWGWLGLACETMNPVCTVSCILLMQRLTVCKFPYVDTAACLSLHAVRL